MIARLHPAAEQEHLARVRYYENERRGLGAKYLNDFDAALAVVCAAPTRFKLVREPDVRRALFRVFPCSVIYRQRYGLVQVLAIMHDHQRPEYWANRLR